MGVKRDIRNVALLGHGGSGKTSLSEAMLYDTGTISRLGRVEEKNTVSDYDEEEKSRGFSVNCSVLPCEWQDHRLNILDVPGYMDFVGEVKTAIKTVEGAVMLICAASGVEVGAEVQKEFLDEESLPWLVFINKMDRDNANFEQAFESLNVKFPDITFVPVTLPIGSQDSFEGVVDLLAMRAYMGEDAKEADIPADMQDEVEAARLELVEYAAEVDDELMLKYLDGEDLTPAEIVSGLAQGTLRGDFVLVLSGSATKNIGVKQLLDAVVHFMPDPAAIEREALNAATEEREAIPPDTAGPLVAQIFKTMADPFVGKISYFRVYSGTLSSDSRVFCINKGEEERLGQLYIPRGQKQLPVDTVEAGEIGSVNKLVYASTGDTLCSEDALYKMEEVTYPEPLYSVAVFPKTKEDLDKLGESLSRLVEEDPTLRVDYNSQTKQTILSGMGASHIRLATQRLAQKFGVDVETELPAIPYRETITKVASAQGRHKKQTGGHGQFGDVYCRFEPLERGEGFEFESEIFGGSVPKQYVPAVEKGIHEIMETGVVAGYPTVDFRCVLYDGSYHPVDSSELSFKLAAHLAFRAAIPEAGPVLLEPICKIKVTVPEEYMGDILGDLNTRRARVLGMDQDRGNGIITALVPLAEIQRYATDLRSMTQGRGIYTREIVHYDIVPPQLIEQIQQEAKARQERAEERAS
ncbi:MAG: elongation factor G [Chloroflexota bacterium]|nr:elongation factor G [Chloroflexota bacterium]